LWSLAARGHNSRLVRSENDVIYLLRLVQLSRIMIVPCGQAGLDINLRTMRLTDLGPVRRADEADERREQRLAANDIVLGNDLMWLAMARYIFRHEGSWDQSGVRVNRLQTAIIFGDLQVGRNGLSESFLVTNLAAPNRRHRPRSMLLKEALELVLKTD